MFTSRLLLPSCWLLTAACSVGGPSDDSPLGGKADGDGEYAPGTAHPFESVPVGESSIIALLAEQTRAGLERAVPEGAHVPRDQHAKAHACVAATVDLWKLPTSDANLVGEHEAVIRFSNGGSASDLTPDALGMAVKILDLPYDTAAAETTTTGRSLDLHAITANRFFVPDVAAFAEFMAAQATGGAEAWASEHPTYASIVAEMKSNALLPSDDGTPRPAHLFESTFTTVVPSALGDDAAVVYRFVPADCGDVANGAFTPPEWAASIRDEGARRAGLERLLRDEDGGRDLCFLIERHVSVATGDAMARVVEDATVDWTGDSSTATVETTVEQAGAIRIAAQDPTVLDAACESLCFTPWHAPADARPIGGIQRLRLPVYNGICDYRLTRNGVEGRDEPSSLADLGVGLTPSAR